MTQIREIKFTNTLTRKKEVFEPIHPGKVKFYTCGPTVYGFIHIGNLRGALVADLIYRYLTKVGYQVEYVRNYTDIDDKIINRANEEKTTSKEISEKYIQEVEKDYAISGNLNPTHKPKATKYIPQIVSMIEDLVKNGIAYVASGEVLYSIDTFEEYGKLSKKNLDDLEAGHRVAVDQKKKSPFDFILWKPAKPGEPSWESPWGKGRPGWHIECSAMIRSILGDQIDIHHGGVDLIFPHHENEIAQSEACTGKSPFVKYWIHHEFLTLSKEKMSKSLGNVFNAREFLKKYGGEVARYMLLGVHYRSIIDFNEALIDQTTQALQRIYEAKAIVSKILKSETKVSDQRAESLWSEFVMDADKTSKSIDAHYANDLNTAGALSELFVLIREFNRILKEPKAESTPAAHLGAQALLDIMQNDIGAVIGIGRLSSEKALNELNAIRATLGDGEKLKPKEIEALLEERRNARKNKNFKRSDEIRDELKSKGVAIKDSPSGTSWSYS